MSLDLAHSGLLGKLHGGHGGHVIEPIVLPGCDVVVFCLQNGTFEYYDLRKLAGGFLYRIKPLTPLLELGASIVIQAFSCDYKEGSNEVIVLS